MFVTQRDRANRVTTTMFRLTGELYLLYVAAAETGLLALWHPIFFDPDRRRKSEEADRWQPDFS
jgi:hypothetical protein